MTKTDNLLRIFRWLCFLMGSFLFLEGALPLIFMWPGVLRSHAISQVLIVVAFISYPAEIYFLRHRQTALLLASLLVQLAALLLSAKIH